MRSRSPTCTVSSGTCSTPVVAQAPGKVGRELKQRLDGLTGLRHGAHLDKIAEEDLRHCSEVPQGERRFPSGARPGR